MLEFRVDTWIMSEVESILKMNAITHPLAELRVVHKPLFLFSKIFKKFFQRLVLNLTLTKYN